MNSLKKILSSMLEIHLLSGKLNISIFTFFAVFLLFYADFSVYTLIVLCCIAIHELSHLVTLKLCGGKVQKINVYPFGIDMVCDMNTLSYAKELAVVLSGGMANLVCALAAHLTAGACHSAPVCFFIYANLLFGIGNLIPLPVFDGGRALHIIIDSLILPDRAYYVRKFADALSLFLFFVLSVGFMLSTNCNFTAVMCVAYTALAAIIYEKLILHKNQLSKL